MVRKRLGRRGFDSSIEWGGRKFLDVGIEQIRGQLPNQPLGVLAILNQRSGFAKRQEDLELSNRLHHQSAPRNNGYNHSARSPWARARERRPSGAQNHSCHSSTSYYGDGLGRPCRGDPNPTSRTARWVWRPRGRRCAPAPWNECLEPCWLRRKHAFRRYGRVCASRQKLTRNRTGADQLDFIPSSDQRSSEASILYGSVMFAPAVAPIPPVFT